MGRPSNKPDDVWRYIEKRGVDECWPWTGAKSPAGYGVFQLAGEQYRAIRIVCWLRDPESITLRAAENSADRRIALHSCDNTGCCNPKHLTVGVPRANTQDMISKGRRPDFKGERGGNAKLSSADILRIREARLFGALQKDLAATHGVSVPTISAAVNHHHYGGACGL